MSDPDEYTLQYKAGRASGEWINLGGGRFEELGPIRLRDESVERDLIFEQDPSWAPMKTEVSEALGKVGESIATLERALGEGATASIQVVNALSRLREGQMWLRDHMDRKGSIV